MIRLTTPGRDGYHMPGEFEPHRGCILIWPKRPGSWPYGAEPARAAFARVIEAISKSEIVYLAVEEDTKNSAQELLRDLIEAGRVELFSAPSDDAWARDVGPTFVVSQEDDIDKRKLRCVDWAFNAWGGEYNGLYASWEKDDAFADAFACAHEIPVYDAHPFVLEGGSVHSDGEGTLLVTETCLLSKGRNPSLTKQQIEEKLKEYLGAEKVLWLPCGIYQDETDEHVDNVCAFVRPGEVVLAWTDNKEDPQYAMSKACLDYLERETDAKGRSITVHRLPIPDHPILVGEEELSGYQFEEGEDAREAGDRLAASYVNFYFSNAAVVLPAFGGENEESDQRAVQIMQKLCPDRQVIPVAAREILLGGGNIHCITQQIPDADGMNKEKNDAQGNSSCGPDEMQP